jgi:DNA-binding response OmpR family regulator
MRVLLVEDEPTLAAYLRRGLERDGWAVDVAADGEQGLWLATTVAYDVIVLDLLLPKLNGFQVCARLREQGVWTAVLVLTAKDGEFDEAEALDTGADDFLPKPFSFVVLTARLRALTRRRSPGRHPVLEAGGVRLDPATRAVSMGERRLRLTPTEFRLLELFLRRPGEVLSKREILEACWDWDFEGDPSIVEVYVHHLRAKLDEPGRIETVRGAGYRFDGA